jgi:tetratricopeptide (TPR) repeat protein
MPEPRQNILERAGKYLQKGQKKRALREYEKLLAREPGDVHTMRRVGDLCAQEGDRQRAVELYMRAAAVHEGGGFQDRAAAIYKQVLVIDQGHLEANLRLADAYVGMGFGGDAVTLLRSAAFHYEAESKVSEQLEVMERLVELGPENGDDRIRLARLYARCHKHDRAWEQFSRAALALCAAGRLDEFVEVAERIVRVADPDVELLNALARVYLQRNQSKRALKMLGAAHRTEPGNPETLDMLAEVFLRVGQPGKAVASYKQMAGILEQRGEATRVQEVWRCILEINPDDPAARARLPREPDELAEADLQDPPDLDAGSGIIELGDDDFEEIGSCTGLRDQMTLQVAVEELVAATAAPEHPDETLEDGLAEADFFIQQGLVDDAVEVLDELAQRHPAHQAIESRLDEILRAQGISERETTRVTDLSGAASRMQEVQEG